jgi:hypothetical protein
MVMNASLHGGVERISETFEADVRMFVADASNGDVAVVDLPRHEVVERISTPAYVMILGLTDDGRHCFAMRGRDTDRDYVTIIHTGYDPTSLDLRLPFVTRTFVGNSPGGTHGGHMATVGGNTSLNNELIGEMMIFQGPIPDNGLAALPTRTIRLAQPDHYHGYDVNGRLYVAHLRGGFIQVLDPNTGLELDRIPGCPRVHGTALDETTGRLFFGCSNHTMVVGTQVDEQTQVVARIPYPREDQRVGSYLKGTNGIFWGSTEGALPAIYKLDTLTEPYQFEEVPVDVSLRRATSDDGAFLLTLTPDGAFQIRDGETGDLIHSVPVAAEFPDLHETVGKAINPDIETLNNIAYVSIPHEGRIAEVDLLQGILLHNITIGGEPVRMVLLDVSTTNSTTTTSYVESDDHGHDHDHGHGDDAEADHGHDHGHDHGEDVGVDDGEGDHDHDHDDGDGHDHDHGDGEGEGEGEGEGDGLDSECDVAAVSRSGPTESSETEETYELDNKSGGSSVSSTISLTMVTSLWMWCVLADASGLLL